MKILQPLYKDEPSLDTMLKNAVEADCEATVAIVKRMFDDKVAKLGEDKTHKEELEIRREELGKESEEDLR